MSTRPADGTATFAAPALETAVTVAVRPLPAGFDEDTRVLLRYRLAIASWVCFGGGAALMLAGLVTGNRGSGDIADGGVEANLAFLLIGGIGLAGLRGQPTLTRLRAIELTLFGALTLLAGGLRYHQYTSLELTSSDLRFGQLAVFNATTMANIFVYFVIMYYGLLIPNTRRRGIAVVAGMSAVPFLSMAAAFSAKPELRPYAAPAVGLTMVGLICAGAGAVFGAYRINTLRREAFEARREAQQVGQYALKHRLGEGGMGEVWLAEHRLLKRPCAVKFIRAELATNTGTATRFVREVQAVTGLTHFNTVRVYDYGRADDGAFYYVMEYLDGPTLQQLVRDHGPLPPGRAVYLLRQLCGALAEAHAAGLVHRDIKPGNVIVTRLGGTHDVAKLLDFGLVLDESAAEGDDRLTRAGVVLGTPAYMPPEQAAGDPVDARGDVYALGAVAFYLLVGRPPFEGKSARQMMAAHLTEAAPALDAAPPDLAAVVARCLAKSPSDRFVSVLELERALADCACAADWSPEQAAQWWAKGCHSGAPIQGDSTRTFA